MQNDPSSLQPGFSPTNEKKDAILWQMAKKRAGFKWGLVTYFIINCLLVAIWYYTSGSGTYFWPMWPMLGWGAGILIQYIHAYHGNSVFSAEKEYEKLKNQYKN